MKKEHWVVGRTAWEGYTVVVAASCIVWLLAGADETTVQAPIVVSAAAVLGLLMIYRAIEAIGLWERRLWLTARKRWRYRRADILKIVRRRRRRNGPWLVWLGRGFAWEQEQAQALRDVGALAERRLAPPFVYRQVRRLFGDIDGRKLHGRALFHGLGVGGERDLMLSAEDLQSHVAIPGTTGAGKGRMLTLLAMQAIHRGDALIVTDPKLDRVLLDVCYTEAKKRGVPFHFFHPGHPKHSVRINPLKNYARVVQIAGRVASLMTGEGNAASFKKYAWMVLNNVAQGMVFAGESPTLLKLYTYIGSGVEDLLIRAGARHFTEHEDRFPAWEQEIAKRVRAKQARGRGGSADLIGDRARATAEYYRQVVQKYVQVEAMDGLCELLEKDRAHHGKMIQNLLPILTALNSGELRELLSPDVHDAADPRPIVDLARVVRKGEVLYVALDSMADREVASNVGSMLLSDLTSVAADRYNYEGSDGRGVTLLADEIDEQANEAFLTQLNKSRGARMAVCFAFQTSSDISTRFGSVEFLYKALGNVNTLIAMRTQDERTQEICAKRLGVTRLRTVSEDFKTTANTDDAKVDYIRGRGVREAVSDDQPAVPATELSQLPDLEAFAMLHDGRRVKLRIPYIEPEDHFPLPHYG